MNEIVRSEIEGFFGKDFRDSGGNLVGLLSTLINFAYGSFRLIIVVKKLFDFIDGDVSIDVLFCCLNQIIRRLQTIHILKADGSLPRIRLLSLRRGTSFYVFIKTAHK